MTTEPGQRRRRKVLTDAMIAALPRQPKRYPYSDPQQVGLFVRVQPKGPHSFAVVGRDINRKQIWTTLGTTDALRIEEAREMARAVRKRLAQGLPAVEPPAVKPESFAAVAANWLKRHVHKNGVRTAVNIERVLKVHVLPSWFDREFAAIRRSDVAALLDDVEEHGQHMADKVATVVRAIGSWYADRSDDYVSPFARIKSRVPETARKRLRVLADHELRAIWRAADEAGAFGALIKLLLLTGQRRDKVLSLKWDDISPAGIWTIRTEAREKGNAGELQLPAQALAIIQAQPRLVGSPFVFATRGAFNSRVVGAFRDTCGVHDWRLHDLRRTSRTLLSRAGVQSEIAERVLGHAVGTIEDTYDRHSYRDEKAMALRKLAALIECIVNPPEDDNVVVLHEIAAAS